jgi:peptide deformylase
MAVLRLCVYPDPVLRQKAKRVTKIDERITQLIDDMIDTMHATGGVGLAAPQVGVSLRVAVLEMPGEETLVLVNPQCPRLSGGDHARG